MDPSLWPEEMDWAQDAIPLEESDPMDLDMKEHSPENSDFMDLDAAKSPDACPSTEEALERNDTARCRDVFKGSRVLKSRRMKEKGYKFNLTMIEEATSPNVQLSIQYDAQDTEHVAVTIDLRGDFSSPQVNVSRMD